MRQSVVVYVAGGLLVAAIAAACERSGRTGDPSAPVTEPRRDERASPTGVGTMAAAPPDATSEPLPPWRVTLDEVIRRFDRGDPVAKVAEALGRVVPDGHGHLRVTTTLSWARAVEIKMDADEVSFWFTTTPLIPVRELDALRGRCNAMPLGDREDGVIMACPPVHTRRGEIDVNGTTDPFSGDGDDVGVDFLQFRWHSALPPAGPAPRAP